LSDFDLGVDVSEEGIVAILKADLAGKTLSQLRLMQ
jgi:hypothetical protein